jgi:predicted 2-oxoglutarate/Fe(II)-dependent dioxygenase YbiX
VPNILYVVRGFFDQSFCRAVRAAMDAGDVEPAEVLSDSFDEDRDVRRASMIEIDPATLAAVERRLGAERERIAAFFDIPLTEREGAGFLRYPPGGFYRPHRDRADFAPWPDAARRRITAVVFLNTAGFTGGLLRVNDRTVTPETGMLAAFPADEIHEVTRVDGGVRDAVVDWFLE